MRFRKLDRFTEGNPKLQERVTVFNQEGDDDVEGINKPYVESNFQGMANSNFDVIHPLSNRRLQVKKGDPFQVIELYDIRAKVRFLDGEAEAKGRSYVLDRLLLQFF